MGQWTTVLGGAHSGKTDFVSEICAPLENVVWWGTASEIAGDVDWQQRLQGLRRGRKSSWQTLDGAEAWPTAAGNRENPTENAQVFVFDSLNLWLAAQMNRCMSLYSASQLRVHLELEFQQLCKSLGQLPCPVILVSADVGSGVVPAGEAGRLFRDLLGLWNRSLVAASHSCISMYAGRALLMPGGQQSLPAAGAPVVNMEASSLRRILFPAELHNL